VLLLASSLPFIGWLICVLSAASGLGSVLEALLARD
jgi:membrane protein YqaA with SNARE-associated domain